VLNKLHRLKKNNDIVKVLKEGKKFTEKFLILKTVSNDSDNTRFAFIVSKKFSKKAVERNRIRRQVAEAVKDSLDKIQKGVDVVILLIPGLQDRTTEEVKETVKKILIKSSLIKK
jgi:ribonuclease P protein component